MRRALSALSEVAPEIARVGCVEELLGLISRRAAELVGVGRCAVFMREERCDLFRGSAGCCGGGPLPEPVERWVAGVAADGVTRELLETGRPVIVANARQDPRTVKSTIRHWDARSLMAVPMRHDGRIVGVIVFDEPGRRHEFGEEDAELAAAFADLAATAVAQVRVRLDLQAKLGAAGRQLQALRRAAGVDERLSDLVLEGRSLRELTASLASLLGKPCAIFRPSGEREALALPEGAPESAVPRLLEPQLAAHPEVRRALGENRASRAFVVGPIPGAGVLHRHVVAPITIGGELWGRLVVVEHGGRFSGGDVVAVRRAATLLALQASAEQRAREADWNAASALAAELLVGSADGAFARRRAERLGVSLEASRAVALFGPRSGREDDGPDFRAVAAAFARAAPRLSAQVAAVPGAAAALVEVPDQEAPEGFAAANREALEAVRLELGGGELLAAISTPRRGRDGYRAAYREARQALDCVRRFAVRGGPALFAAEELGVGGLLLSGSDPEAVAAFAEEALGQLAGDPSKADLLTTLGTFFDSMGSVRETAAAFEVHENTIRYRLARVEELTGLAVTHDPDAQLRARLALLVLRLQGRLPESQAWGFRQAATAHAARRAHRVPAC